MKASQEELVAFEEWLHRVRPSGDVDQVQRAWEASDEFADRPSWTPFRLPQRDRATAGPS